MKTIIKLTALFFIFTLSLNSCKKDEKEEVKYTLDTDYFSVNNANYNKKEFPEASGNAPTIDVINGNTSVIPGGSNPIRVISSADISKILIGVKDINGYYSFTPTTKNTQEAVLFYISMNQNLEDEEFEIMIALEGTNGAVSEVSTIAVSLVQAGTGRLQINCSWDQINDVDLHLQEPNGEDIYYANRTSDNAGELDLDSNAGCSLDYVNNENITYSDTAIIEDGEYIVRIDFWSNCNATENTNYNVKAYFEGELITPTFGTNPFSGAFETEDADMGGSGSGVTVMKFQLPTGSTKSMELKPLVKFNFPADKSAKPDNLSPHKQNNF